MPNKPRIDMPIIVEGKYDKAHLTSLFDCYVITTDGFGIFKEQDKLEYIKNVAKEKGIIILTDSDGGGLVIRNYIKSVLPVCHIINLYTPQITGKEKRKKCSSKEGYLGVEGIEKDTLLKLFEPYFSNSITYTQKNKITKSNLYEDGFFGKSNSSEKRKNLQEYLNLPKNISSNALIDAINTLSLQEKYRSFIDEQRKQNC